MKQFEELQKYLQNFSDQKLIEAAEAIELIVDETDMKIFVSQTLFPMDHTLSQIAQKTKSLCSYYLSIPRLSVSIMYAAIATVLAERLKRQSCHIDNEPVDEGQKIGCP
jgi:hypothetical protein